MRRAVDRLVAVVARLATRGLFRSVEVIGFDDLTEGTPRLIVANHFNGFVDPVVIAGALGRLPRFIAKATLWKTPGVPLLLGAAGVLPVHRTVDGGGDNQGTFREVVRELHGGETVAIFPEGTTHDNPHLSPVRTGAARLALDAAADGVAGMEVVPVGVTFEDKVALRTRVVVRAGTPIDPAAPAYCDDGRPVGSADHDAVHRLTAEIRSGLADVSPDFGDLLDAAEMRRAADVALRSRRLRPLAEVPLAERESLAKQLDRLPPARRDPVATAAAEYDLVRSTINVRDEVLEPPVSFRVLVVRLVTTAVLVAVLAPLALVGVVVNLLPVLLVTLAGLAARAPVSKGTNRVLVGLVAFPATWAALAAFDVGADRVNRLVAAVTSPLDPALEQVVDGRGGWVASLVLFAALPLLGLLAVWLAERASVAYHSYRAVSTTMNRRGQLDDLRARRRGLQRLVEEAVTEPPG